MERAEDRPSWLTEDCPQWCTREHTEDDHPDDRTHRSAGIVVPVVLGSTAPGVEIASAAECVIELFRRVGKRETWLHVAETEGLEHRLLLTWLSAGRVAEAIIATLAATPT